MIKGRITILILMALFLSGFSQFAHADQWAKTYGGSNTDQANFIRQTSDGGYIVAGQTKSFGAGNWDVWVLKLDSSSNVSWQKTYGGSNEDIANSIKQTSDGGYIVAGQTKSFGAGNNDAWVLKLDSSGNVSWQKTLGGSNEDYATSIQQTSDGGYIVAGYSASFVPGYYVAWVLKLDSSGNVTWQKTYGGGSYGENAYSIQQTSDGGYIVAGYTFGAAYLSDVWVLKLDSSGNVSWQKRYGGSNYDIARSIQQTSDGGYIVAGWTYSFGAGTYDVWVLKLDSSGNVSWQKTYGGANGDYTYSIQQTSDGGYIVAGFLYNNILGAWVLKLDSSGNVSWQKTYGGANVDYTYSIQQTSDGGYIVAGQTDTGDALVLKLNSSGDIINCPTMKTTTSAVNNTSVTGVNTSAIASASAVSPVTSTAIPANSNAAEKLMCNYPAAQWAKTYGGSNEDIANSIQQTSDGGYIVAGETSSFGAGGGDAWVLKLNISGNVSWQKRYGGSNYDIARSIRQTSDGGYIVAGYTYSFGAGVSDAWVLKLDGSGNVSWQKTYGGSNYDKALYIQQTSDGGYIVAGETSSFGAGNWDVWVIKLDSSGNVSWQKRYGGSSSDYTNAIRQTLDGGYIVAGNTLSYGAGGLDAWVLKLDSSGNVTWQKTYGGGYGDYTDSIQQTSDGGYIVAGYTYYFGAGVSDAWVLKLDSSGNVTWQKIYGGSDEDLANSVQQTADGGYIAAGYTYSFGAGDYDAWVLKLNAGGDIIDCPAEGTSTAVVGNTGVTGTNSSASVSVSTATPVTSTAIPANTNAAETEVCYYQQPEADIKANGSDGPLTITSSQSLKLTIALDDGSMAGNYSDWWVLCDTSMFGWYHYDLTTWVPGIVVTYQGPLFDLGTYQVMDYVLPAGNYTCYFGFDTIMNGAIDMGQIYYDSVGVTVTP